MNRSLRKLIVLAAVSLAALLTVGVAGANAHGGHGYRLAGVSTSALVTQAAKKLDVTRAKLKAAIVDAANARIDAAVQAGDVDADDAADLKEEAADNLRFAIAVSRTRTVAANLGITTAKLNDGFRAARRELIVARIDEAVKDGDLDADDAAELKEELEDIDLPGYKAAGFRGVGYGYGHGHGFRR